MVVGGGGYSGPSLVTSVKGIKLIACYTSLRLFLIRFQFPHISNPSTNIKHLIVEMIMTVMWVRKQNRAISIF